MVDVSVLMPVWNAAETLDEALSDVCAQVGVDFEAVVVLDGPTDESAAIAYAWAARDVRVRVLAREHEGIVGALNAGLEACKAPIVARFDADDRMGPERLLRQQQALSRGDVSVVACEVDYCALGAPLAGMARHVAWLNGLDSHAKLSNARFIDAPVAHPAVAFRREVVTAVGGYRNGNFAEDHDLWLRLFERGVEFGKSSGEYARVVWRDRGERLTRVDGRYGREARRELIHRYLRGGPLAGRRAVVWGAGEYGKWHGRALSAAGVEIDAYIDIDPRKVGQRIGGVMVEGAESLGPPDGRLILSCVAADGARAIIASRLEGLGYREGVDWFAMQ